MCRWSCLCFAVDDEIGDSAPSAGANDLRNICSVYHFIAYHGPLFGGISDFHRYLVFLHSSFVRLRIKAPVNHLFAFSRWIELSKHRDGEEKLTAQKQWYIVIAHLQRWRLRSRHTLFTQFNWNFSFISHAWHAWSRTHLTGDETFVYTKWFRCFLVNARIGWMCGKCDSLESPWSDIECAVATWKIKRMRCNDVFDAIDFVVEFEMFCLTFVPITFIPLFQWSILRQNDQS